MLDGIKSTIKVSDNTAKNTPKILVTGGCGYIGSHVVRQLSEAGYQVTVVDNLSTGFRDALLNNEVLYKADLADDQAMQSLFQSQPFSAVLHFAASIVVPESVAHPVKYYENNTINTLKLLKWCLQYKVSRFIFSSTAAVYGDAYSAPVEEDFAPNPTNPYGRSKLMDEWILRDIAAVHSLKYVILRYFNVAGADPKGRIGQRTPNATHLIKVACEKACGKRDGLSVFGNDYATADGTGVRDYIHVEDLASAHVEALRYLEKDGASQLFNCGYGRGFSVKEVLDMVEKVTGKTLNATIAPRRPGDVSSLVANVDKISRYLPQWKPQYQSLETIVASAFQWEKSL